MKEKQIERLRSASRKLIRELGMLQLEPENSQKTPGHWHTLIEVAKEPGITISELARLLLMSTSSLSRIVKLLRKNGDIDVKEARDKREKALFLTPQGIDEVKRIDQFSDAKIQGAFEYLSNDEIREIIQAIATYGQALEKSRIVREAVKIVTLSTSRTIRKQIVQMITEIQKNEFSIPIPDTFNIAILKAEEEYYYNHSYNFWYATDDEGKVIGSIGLKKIDHQYAEIKKFFVVKEYRGKGVAQKLFNVLLKAAAKHEFKFLVLGTTDKFLAAHKFYANKGFAPISKKQLPIGFETNPIDSYYFRREL